MASFTDEEIDILSQIGNNSTVNEKYLEKYPFTNENNDENNGSFKLQDDTSKSTVELEKFIKQKYVQKKWMTIEIVAKTEPINIKITENKDGNNQSNSKNASPIRKGSRARMRGIYHLLSTLLQKTNKHMKNTFQKVKNHSQTKNEIILLFFYDRCECNDT